MNWFAEKTLKYKKAILAVFLGLSVISIFSIAAVNVNYNILDYLPEDSSSTKAITI